MSSIAWALTPGLDWSPLRLVNLGKVLQWLKGAGNLDALTYESVTVGQRNVLKDYARTGDRREPRAGRCIKGDGTNDVATATYVAAGVITGTISFWLKNVDAVTSGIFAAVGHTTNRGFEVRSTNGADLQIWLATDATNYTRYTATVDISTAWVHVAATFSGTTVKLYVNGVDTALTPTVTGTGFGGTIPTTNVLQILKALVSNNYGNAYLKGIRFYSVAKSQAEITAIRGQASTPTTYDTTGLIAWYNCDEECCSMLYDSSGNGRHAVIANASTLPTGTFFVADATLPFNLMNEYGGSFGRTMLKNAAGTWNAGWLSSNTLTGDGYVEFIVDALVTTLAFGLTADSTFPATNIHNTIDFGVAYASGSTIQLYENGAAATPNVTLAIGDRIRIRRTGTVMTVEQNGVTVATFASASPASNTPLYAVMTANATTATPDITSFNGSEPLTGLTQTVNMYRHIVPRSLSTPAQDVLGNTVNFTGQCPHYATSEPSCVTGNATDVNVNFGSALIPASADFLIELIFKADTGAGAVWPLISQHDNVAAGRWRIAHTATVMQFTIAAGVVATATTDITAGNWYSVSLARVGNDYTLIVMKLGMPNSRVIGTGTSATALLTATNTRLLVDGTGTNFSADSIVDLKITTGGVTKTFPLQDGKGTDETNRDISWFGSDGSGGVIADAIVNGTVATIRGTTCPYAKDYAIASGAYINANNEVICAKSATLAADGTALNRPAGKHSSPWSKLNRNPFSAAGLNGAVADTGVDVAEVVQDDSPVDSNYRRTKSNGDDRYLIAGTRSGYTLTGLSGSEKANLERYVA
jgi:hypothetical protein